MGEFTSWMIVLTVILNTVTLFFLTLSVNSLVRQNRRDKPGGRLWRS